jgi:hypothetical protein
MRRFYWQKFLNNRIYYDTGFLIEVISYIIKEGIEINEWVGKWTRLGTNKSIFGYSFNNEPCELTTLPLEYDLIKEKIDYLLLNFLVREQFLPVEKLKEKLRFKKNNSYLLIEDPGCKSINKITRFKEFNSLDLNYNPQREFFPERENAYLKGSPRVLLGYLILFEYTYTFRMEGYEHSGWTERIERKKNETTEQYLDKCYNFMSNIIK